MGGSFHATHQKKKPRKCKPYMGKQTQAAEAAYYSKSVGNRTALAQSVACDLKVKHATAAEKLGFVTRAK